MTMAEQQRPEGAVNRSVNRSVNRRVHTQGTVFYGGIPTVNRVNRIKSTIVLENGKPVVAHQWGGRTERRGNNRHFRVHTVHRYASSLCYQHLNREPMEGSHGSRITGNHGGGLSVLGSFRAGGAGGNAEPHGVTRWRKIEIEIPFAAVGG